MKHLLPVSDADFRAALVPDGERLLLRLIDRLYPSVTNFLKGIGAGSDEAREIFYISIEVLWERGRNRGFEPGFSFYPFLLEVGKHRWYNLLRRKKSAGIGITEEVFWVLNPEPNIQELLEVVEFREKLFEGLGQLGDPCQKILLLWAEGTPFEKIAQEMNYASALSARQQKFKCLDRLKKVIGDGLND